MNELQQEERQRDRRRVIEESIKAAMSNSWEEAADKNRRLVEQFEPDVEAWNRLGKAFAELGRIADAREAYAHALRIEPGNAIARRNAERLSLIREDVLPVSRDRHDSVDARFFIEETGKTIARSIFTAVPKEVLAKLSAGDRLKLEPRADLIAVTTTSGQELGMLDGKLSSRLVELFDGGNQYEAAVVRIEGRYIRVMVREVHQAPQLTGRVSFPPETSSGFKPYTKDTLVRQDRMVEDEEDVYGTYEVEADDIVDVDDLSDSYDDGLDN
jgi:tetratricopeptide (TPR) repeat protein